MKILISLLFIAVTSSCVFANLRSKRWSEGDGHGGDGSGVRGVAGVDYPVYEEIPPSTFNCMNYAPGLYADVELQCAVYHSCDESMRKASFLCSPGTLFNQKILACDFWWNANCESAPDFYFTNDNTIGGEPEAAKGFIPRPGGGPAVFGLGGVAPGPVPPKPRPAPRPQPRPAPRPIPRPIPRPQPRPVPRPVPRPIPRPVPRPIPRPYPRPVPRPIPRPVPRPQPRPIPRPVPIPHPRPVPRPQPRPIPRPVPIPHPRPVPRPQPRPIPRPVPRPQPRPIPRPVPIPHPRPVPRPQPRPIPRPVPIPQPRPVPRPQPRPIPRPVPRPQPRPVPRPRPIPPFVEPTGPQANLRCVCEPGQTKGVWVQNGDYGSQSSGSRPSVSRSTFRQMMQGGAGGD